VAVKRQTHLLSGGPDNLSSGDRRNSSTESIAGLSALAGIATEEILAPLTRLEAEVAELKQHVAAST
jgi:hypothetical protein